MAVPWGLIALLGGIAYGYFTPGKTDKSRLYGRAFVYGLVLAVVLVVIGWLTGFNPLGIANDPLGFVIALAITLVFFVVGVWFGDWLESRTGARGAGRRPV